jgi:type I restriction enzyme R subunit
MPVEHKEIAFEAGIEDCLLTLSGYVKGKNENFDEDIALDPTEVLDFIKTTQPKEWTYLESNIKEKARETLLDSLCRALDSKYEGCLMVLRHGFKCYGKLFRVAFFKPASGLNQETLRLYDCNRLSVTRQLRYSNSHGNKIDLVLSLNGIPIVTAEIKNPMTGQTWHDAVDQYKNDRDPKDLIFQFKKRTLVHFVIDTEEVYMTTELTGRTTTFLPFNKGNGTGAGNPNNPKGYKTAYLWEDVWQRDSLLDIIGRFVHIEQREVKLGERKIVVEKIIFPRYHQLDAVRKLITDARARGSGNNYLVQHSTGSGKSLTIAWLAYRLSSLHDEKDRKIFGSVVVITDRLVLDQQLQNTIYQFEHKEGVIAKIDVDSAQLAQSLSAEVPIIITTIQKFPFVTEKIGKLPNRNYAVIIDEAHSSQSGERARELKSVLGATETSDEDHGESFPDYEDEVLKVIAERGRQPNISFFAFTATPKYKTLEVFGQRGPDQKPHPFHLYSMRQAIEEGFILDVLRNYITYKTYYKLNKSIADDPTVEKRKAARALARFVSLHPHNISQKTEVMIEHFWNFTRHKIGGKAKAMVVTSSRLHAVRYKIAFDSYIAEKGYQGIKALVAFSGTVTDPDVPGLSYTETGMNKGIKETELPERFAGADYQVLLVAEKYQTGFDQPLLHTMYVDRRLSGLDAVQTLSRLNRTCIGKEDTFVLDFVNEPTEIQDAFQPYYEQSTIGAEVNPDQLYEISAKLQTHNVYYQNEVEEFAKVFYKRKETQSRADHALMNAILDPVVDRYKTLEERKEEFRKTLTAFLNLYSFLSQVIPFEDPDLEKLYSFLRFLLTKLPRGFGETYNFEKTSRGTRIRHFLRFQGDSARVMAKQNQIIRHSSSAPVPIQQNMKPSAESVSPFFAHAHKP